MSPQPDQQAAREPPGGPAASGTLHDNATGPAPTKSRKACVNCRRQKMRCRVDGGPRAKCNRCHRAGIQCVFVPRANAAAHSPDDGPVAISIPSAFIRPLVEDQESAQFRDAVLRRLKRLEEHAGLESLDSDGGPVSSPDAPRDGDPLAVRGAPESGPRDAYIAPLWPALKALRATCFSRTEDQSLWEEDRIKRLWLGFHDAMLGLHFLPSKQTFSSPTPVMLAAILYTSSVKGRQPDVASLATGYLSVLTRAIAQLCIPSSEIGRCPRQPARAAEEWAFQTILGIILAGLLREGISKETGVWISIAYRLILEHCPANLDGRSLEWQGLFTGLQIVDLEHASIHLSCPVIPITAPFQRLRISSHDQLYRLSRMAHTGLMHFTGRGLPTIWSCLSESDEGQASANPGPLLDSSFEFSGVDSAVIRDWARGLDYWLVQFGAAAPLPTAPEAPGQSAADAAEERELKEAENRQRMLVFRQYVLHRVLVLSIYLPARGSDIFSNTTPRELNELLVSARAAVRLQLADSSIWSNFDLVIITWAALIVLQGVEGGVGEPDDLDNVGIHLSRLQEARGPNGYGANLNALLARRLQDRLAGLGTPNPVPYPEGDGTGFGCSSTTPGTGIDGPWSIFNEESLQNGYDLIFFDGQPQLR